MKLSKLIVVATGAVLSIVSSALYPCNQPAVVYEQSNAISHVQKDVTQAPPLSISDLDGESLDWSDFDGRTVILYFHTERTKHGSVALHALADSLERLDELTASVSILLVTDNHKAGLSAQRILSSTGFSVRVGLDFERSLVGRYDVIAFPTAYVVDAKGIIIASARGYSAFIGFHLTNACRYASGLIDQAQFEALRDGEPKEIKTDKKNDSPEYRMAIRLVKTGHLKSALPVLTKLANETPPRPEILKHLIHLHLRAGNDTEAESWLNRLTAIDSSDPSLSLFQIRLNLAHDELDLAREHLSSLRTPGPHFDRVLAELFEREGRFEEAADLYRDALDSLLFFAE